MEGQPVWLASVSLARQGRTVATGNLTPPERAVVLAVLRELLAGVGDTLRQRLFRMNLTMCLHRALTATELTALPESFHQAEAIDLAGGPVEILWENVPQRLSTQPCRKPGRFVPHMSRPDLWLPTDCETCPPCLARAALETYRPEAVYDPS